MQNHNFLANIKTIAIVGLSNKPERASYQVAEYLLSKGYEIIPVNPTITEVFGKKSYESLQGVPKEIVIDLVDIFRKSEEVLPIVQTAVEMGVKHIWMQEGVKNDEAIKYAEEHGVTVAADICIMKTLKRL